MHHKQSFLVLYSMLLLIVILSSCGGRHADDVQPAITNEEPIPTVTVDVPRFASDTLPIAKPSPTPVWTESAPVQVEITVEPTESAYQADLVNLPSDVLDRFRSRGHLTLTTTFDDNSTEVEILKLEGAFAKMDNSFGFDRFFRLDAVQSTGDALTSVAIYEVDDVIAKLSNGEWYTLDRRSAFLAMRSNHFDTPLIHLSTGLAEAGNIGHRILNETEVYQHRISDPDLFLAAAGLEMVEGQEVESVQIDVWIASEQNYIAAYHMAATINDAVDFDQNGNRVRSDQTIDWYYEVYDVGSEFEIVLPEEAPKPTAFAVPGFAESEFPIPVGAEMRINMFGQTEIVTDLTEAEVFDFYAQTLAQLGWSLEGDFGVYEVKKEDLSFNLTTMTIDQGKTMVQIRSH